MRAITTKLCDMHVFDSAGDNRSLQTMDGHLATPEECSDLLTFRNIGQSYYSAYVKHYIIRDPSASVPLHLRRLQTFCSSKTTRKKLKLKEREQFLVNRCMRRQLAWNAVLSNILVSNIQSSPALFVLLMEHFTRVKKAMLLSFWRHDIRILLLVWFLAIGLLTVLLWKACF